jgi:hypothetical protein
MPSYTHTADKIKTSKTPAKKEHIFKKELSPTPARSAGVGERKT